MKYIKYIFLVLIVLISTIFINNNKISIKVDKLMIIVHPEDGLIWGGNELAKGNYLVLCITCNKNNKDFIRIMNKMNNDYVLLNYNEDTEFIDEYNILNRDLSYYINKYDYKKIITHNKEGEYGNIQNRIINERVTKLVDNKDILYYFSNYYLKDNLEESNKLYKLTNKEYETKIKYLSMFKDKEYILEFKHIIPYESFLKWGEA